MNKATLASLALLLFPAAAFATPADHGLSGFSDVSTSHPNAEAIAYVKAQGSVQGYGDGTFRPDQMINRAEFTKIIMETRYHGSTYNWRTETRNCFKDVANEWFAPYVCSAMSTGIVGGYSDGNFRPAKDINFVEATKILTEGLGLELAGRPNLTWYEPYVKALELVHAIPMSIGGFDHRITRGEMAEMVYRLRENITDEPTLTYDQLSSWKTLRHFHGWRIMYPGSFQPSANTMHGGPEDSEDIEIQSNPPLLAIDPSNGVSHRESFQVVREALLPEGVTFGDFATKTYGFNQEKGYATGSLEHGAYAGVEAYEFTVNHGYVSNASDGFLTYPARKVVFLYYHGVVYRIMFPKNHATYADIFSTFQFVPEPEGCPVVDVDQPVVSLFSSKKSFVQISWNTEIASRFNVYRSDSGDSTWERIISDFPREAGSAVDYAYPKTSGLVFYRVASLNEEGQECRSSEKATVFVGSSSN